jgi:hypothetical protein
MNRESAAAREGAAHFTAGFYADIGIPVQPETLQEPFDDSIVIRRHNAQMIARLVRHAIRQSDFDVAGGTSIVLTGVFQLGDADDFDLTRANSGGNSVGRHAFGDLYRVERLHRPVGFSFEVEAELISQLRDQCLQPIMKLCVNIAACIQLLR